MWWKKEWTVTSVKIGSHQVQKSLDVWSGNSWVLNCMTVSFLLWVLSLDFYFISIRFISLGSFLVMLSLAILSKNLEEE